MSIPNALVQKRNKDTGGQSAVFSALQGQYLTQTEEYKHTENATIWKNNPFGSAVYNIYLGHEKCCIPVKFL